ncbi:MAG: RNA polymerase sigma factor [Sandaracinus sp.]|nr:RNA polymerase sigma factor [Sandaracinus sp.]MCB9634061.1 RNA polymerase sigma factor [Sandaracinus sp.]
MSEQRQTAGELYRAHASFVAGFLLRLGVPRDEMEDVLQDVFVVAHQRGGFSPGLAKPTTWLAEIALRVWSNRKRSSRRRPTEPVENLESRLQAGDDPEQTLRRRQALERVQRCLEGLDLDHRAVFVLFELEGESCADIARALNVPLGTVHRRLHVARGRFQEAYAKLEGGDDRG